MNWISKAIQDGSLVAVRDGSYIRQLHPNLCLVAFVLECAKGRGKITRSFSESTLAANARGELLGLMAIHLLLVSVNIGHNILVGSEEVVSDCLGGLKPVVHLPPTILDPFVLQALGHPKKHTRQLLRPCLHLILLACESPPGWQCCL
jgi:hypothetical protein